VEDILIATVGPDDLDDLMPLVRAYCDFYAVAPPERALRALSTALLEAPDLDGVQLIARTPDGTAVGFATIFWSWSTLSAARIGVMNDIYVDPAARRGGVGAALIAACRERCVERGARWLSWQTAADNIPAQALYERMGAKREQWVDYSLEAAPQELT
jgi:GNAT superfamily N-acetyltransferase